MKKPFGRKNKLRVVLVPPLQDHRLLPLGAGLLKASALADPFIRERTEITIIEPVGTPEEVVSRVCRLRPHLAGFTLYGDISLTKKAAAGVRRGCGAMIVFGGPAVGDGTPMELFSGGGADYAVAGEAERSFPALLRAVLGRGGIDSVKGLSRLENGEVTRNPPEPEPADLGALPSPHLGGVFKWPGYLRMVLEMSRGCREGCLYCCISRKTRSFDLPRVRAELKKIMDDYPEARTIFLADPDVCQGPRMAELLRMLAGAAARREMTVEIQVAPRRLDRRSIPLFNDKSFNLGVGVQSVSPETCRLVNRRLDMADLEEKLKLLAAEAPRAKITLSFITGLPGDTFEKVLRSFDWALSVNAGAYFHRLSVYPGTPLSRAAERLGIKYKPRYPYHAVSTPAMDGRNLSRALAEAAGLSLPANLVFSDKYLGFLFRYIAKGREKAPGGLPRLELARRLDRLARG
ncbi:MAG TPA: hypothetical protein DDW67_04990, partial [Elusimicrobia bacterium]|nr:hypothetical protein [Elusimicrobiota bacterium]